MGWSKLLDHDWDLNAVHEAGSRCISDRCHWLDEGTEHPHRIALSVHNSEVNRVKESIRQDIEGKGLQAQYIVSGMGEYLYVDVLSVQAGKRSAMDYVRRLYGISKERVVTAGDSGNDVLMLEGAPVDDAVPVATCAAFTLHAADMPYLRYFTLYQ
jgi:sucrose-phosphate synthase